MSTHNICFYGDVRKYLTDKLSYLKLCSYMYLSPIYVLNFEEEKLFVV